MSLTRYFRVGQSCYNRMVQLMCLVLLTVGLLTDYRPHHPVTRLVMLATFLPGCQRDLKVLIKMLPELLFSFQYFEGRDHREVIRRRRERIISHF